MKIHFLSLLVSLFCFQSAHAATWRVGPTRTYLFCSQVAPLVQNGDTVLIDYAIYVNDPQVKWTKNNLLIKGVGGRPRLQAGSIIANDAVNGKGIFVISGANVTVENIEFANAVVIDNNGAGIRQEGPNLLVRYCKFTSNEMGILCGNIANCKTVVEYSEFINGGSALNPGYQHNIYINHIDTLVFRYNYTHDAIAEGHELKSRANYNFILYNRISNEQSEDSRTIDLPNGGTSVLVGNIIEQGPNSANSNLLGYGLEGLSNAVPHNLWICNNTFINKKTTGSFINIAAGTDTLFLKNNILAGAKTGGLIIGTATVLDSSHNIVNNNIAPLGFADAALYDYHLEAGSPAIDAGIAISKNIRGYALLPDRIYKDTCDVEMRNNENAIDIGAFEYNQPLAVADVNAARLIVFPNPASDMVHVDVNGENLQRIEICDLNGRLLRAHATADFSIAHLAAGMYMVVVRTDKTTHTCSIIKN
ncbi:MAG TPA: T9SS type A sorting domain-containing protein, partial [Saprospiraceae bacterium]|nr:T9SS type A sorting domain-containing protein [Saprospiraceae bacterium]